MNKEEENKKKSEAITTKIGEGSVKCPMCGNVDFYIGDGHFSNIVQDAPGIKLGGKAVPTAYIICDKCGFVSQHALGVLGLMDLSKFPPIEEKPEPAASVTPAPVVGVNHE